MELSINCFVLGDSDTFTATVPKEYFSEVSMTTVVYSALTVLHFTEIIKNQVEHAVPNPIDPNSMKLWKVDIDDGSLKDISTVKDIENKFNGKKMKLPATNTSNKRIKLEDKLDKPDQTEEFLDEILRPFDVEISLTNVAQLLSAPLLRKLPTLHYASDFSDKLEYAYSSSIYSCELCILVDNVMNKVFRERPGAEFGFGCAKLDVDRHNRTIHAESSTSEKRKKLDRPDVTIYYNRVLVMLGEEKALSNDLRVAENDLDGYFSYWNPLAFGRLPLVMAFAAAGTKLQFYCIIWSTNQNVWKLVISYQSEVIIDHIIIWHFSIPSTKTNTTINFIRMLRTWDRDGYLQTPRILQLLYGTVFPKLGGKYVLFDYSPSKYSMSLELGPVGYTTIPQTENELKNAILDVLKNVKILHRYKVVHRDIRWENIIRLMDNSWMLIDFEEAAFIGSKRYKAPEYREDDTCKKAGDIWMIGNLINNPRIKFGLSETAENFRNGLMFRNPDVRPTAADAIKNDWFNDM
ncbi:hypothetical protein RhiirA4_474379 [Rhizophagus irregularis]|uniref:Protein kinase domain-containing protein n=1 Tax=Rhizophagus irregularis TaxID=588596 RepID=A0A2I1H8B0_9GLOM|nr:hypothetical protein RhiirA4_474379 [Rhizophagus irregularis]